MAFIGALSGSSSSASVSAITGSLIIADRPDSLFPSLPSSNAKLFISGWNGVNAQYPLHPGDVNALILGGDTVVSGVMILEGGDDGTAFGMGFSVRDFFGANQGAKFLVSGSIGKMDANPDEDWNTSNSVFMGDLKVSGSLRVGEGAGSIGGTISGSIHETAGGESYLVAGSNVTITSASNGQVTIASSGGGGGGISWDGSTANGIATYKDGDEATVEANLTFDGTDMLVAAAGKVQFRDTGIYLNSPANGELEISADGADSAAITLTNTNAAGGMEFAVGTGGFNPTTSGLMALTSSMNNANAIQLFASAGGMAINAAGAAGEDIDITNTGGSINITASEDAANAIVLTAGNGGIDLTAGGAAGEDIDITNSAGSVNITGGETAADSVTVQGTGVQILASNTTHGLKLGTGTSNVPVTIGHTTSEVTVGDNLTVTGDLTVNGTTTTIDSTNLNVKDPFVLLGDGAQAANANSGIVFVSGSSTGATRPDVVFARTSNNTWGIGSIASNSGSITSATSMTADIGFNAGSLTGSTVSTPVITGLTGLALGATTDSSFAVVGSGQDLDLSVTGGSTQELRLASAGTGASALHLNASAGSVDIDSGDNVTVDAVDEITLTTTSADGHISLVSAHTDGVALHIDANADAGSIVDIDGGIIDMDATATLNMNAVLCAMTGSSGIQIKGGAIGISGSTGYYQCANGLSLGDDTGWLSFNGSGAVAETGITTWNITPGTSWAATSAGTANLAGTITGITGSTRAQVLGAAVDIDATAAITLTAGGASTWSTSAGALTITGTGGLAMDSAGTAAVDIATAAAAKTITIGNDASAKVDINALIVELDSAGTIVLDSATTTDIDSTGILSLNSGAVINIGNDDDDFAINIGGTGTRTITLGSATSTLALNTTGGASTVTVANGTASAMKWTDGTDDLLSINTSALATYGTDAHIVVGHAGGGANEIALVPGTDAVYNLGTPSLRWANVYTGDLHLRNERGNWTMVEESTYLSLTNNDTGKVYRLLMEEVSDDSPSSDSSEATKTSKSSKKKRSL